VALISAAVIALPIAIASIPRDGGGIVHDLFWPDRLTPLISFGFILVSLLPLFLGYYHLGRIGLFLGLAFSAMAYFVVALSALLVFVGHSVLFGAFAYFGVCLIVCTVMFSVHVRASSTPAIRDAQRLLRLVPYIRLPL
jgi:hypothetical protein